MLACLPEVPDVGVLTVSVDESCTNANLVERESSLSQVRADGSSERPRCHGIGTPGPAEAPLPVPLAYMPEHTNGRI